MRRFVWSLIAISLLTGLAFSVVSAQGPAPKPGAATDDALKTYRNDLQGERADIMAKKPQIQERLTTEIADLLYKELRATGVMVVIEAEHLCMEMRGVKKPGAKTITSALRGGFLKDPRTRSEAMALIREKS